ncbi:unnamed protein product [Leuciscus chuanchicus]
MPGDLSSVEMYLRIGWHSNSEKSHRLVSIRAQKCSKADRQLNKQRNLFREDTDRAQSASFPSPCSLRQVDFNQGLNTAASGPIKLGVCSHRPGTAITPDLLNKRKTLPQSHFIEDKLCSRESRGCEGSSADLPSGWITAGGKLILCERLTQELCYYCLTTVLKCAVSTPALPDSSHKDKSYHYIPLSIPPYWN